MRILKIPVGDFPGGPGVKNLICHSGEVNLIPGQRTKIPCALGQLSLCAETTEIAPSGAPESQPESLCAAMKDPA